MTESRLVARLRVELSMLGARIFRNNVGMAIDRKGHTIRFGLCAGSSDLIGWVPVTITREMVGREVAVFTALECKSRTGRASTRQKNFLAAVRAAGGIAVLARSVEDVTEIILNYKGA